MRPHSWGAVGSSPDGPPACQVMWAKQALWSAGALIGDRRSPLQGAGRTRVHEAKYRALNRCSTSGRKYQR